MRRLAHLAMHDSLTSRRLTLMGVTTRVCFRGRSSRAGRLVGSAGFDRAPRRRESPVEEDSTQRIVD
jgi:hypothetical protein